MGSEEVIKVGRGREREPDPRTTGALSLPALSEDQQDVGAHSQQAGCPLKQNPQHPDLGLPSSRAMGAKLWLLRPPCPRCFVTMPEPALQARRGRLLAT